VRVLTLNVEGFAAGVDRVAEVIRATDPDVALLAEAWRSPSRRLAATTGRHLAFGATRRVRRFGNAVLLRERPVIARRVVLSRARGREPRGATFATAPDGVTYVATHLGLSASDRERDARALLAALDGVGPLVVGGDFNDRPGGPATRLLAERFTDAFEVSGGGSGDTFPASAPLYRIDYLFCSRELTPTRAAVVPIVASDHLAVVADIAYVAPSASAS
jgi:endonuclease/exonuclease/phosphatase family metal-dependent hydrolase